MLVLATARQAKDQAKSKSK